MRLRRTEIGRRINANLAIRSSDSRLSSYAGLELFRQYLASIGLNRTMRDRLTRYLPRNDYGPVAMVLVFVALILSGGRRLRHLSYAEADPVFTRFCSLTKLPSINTAARWIGAFDDHGVDALRRLNWDLAKGAINSLSLGRLTIDIDGTVVSTGMQVEGARRGYNPHRRKVPSYYPITAYEANSGVVINTLNRSGNVHDGKASVAFIGQTLDQLRNDLGFQKTIESRLDGAFFRRDVLETLDRHRVEYAIKTPFHDWLGLNEKIVNRKRWKRITEEVECFSLSLRIKPWRRTERVFVFRRLVNHKRVKHFQFDLFDPDDGHYEFSAVTTNKRLAGSALWKFMNGRGTHEKVYGELKTGFAFNTIPSRRFAANSAWQVLCVLAFNLNRGFQSATTAERRCKSQKRQTHAKFEHINSLRHRLLNRAALLVNSAGKQILDLGSNVAVFGVFQVYQERLKSAPCF